jgi:hypothetical protein
MNRSQAEIQCTFCSGASECDNPYDRHTQPKEHITWRDAFWAVWEHCQPLVDLTLKEEKPEQRQFALIWRPFVHPFRLRVNDMIRMNGRLGRVIRVTECAAVVLLNRPARRFVTRFDKPVAFEQSPVLVRIAANSETAVLNRNGQKKRKPERRRA